MHAPSSTPAHVHALYLRATHFAIEVRSALRTVQSLLNGGSSHVRVPHRAGQLGDGSGARRFRPLLGSWPSFPSGFAHAPTFPLTAAPHGVGCEVTRDDPGGGGGALFRRSIDGLPATRS